MELFADRYLYEPPKTWFDGRKQMLWPVYVWKVIYPDELNLGANLFQEAILGLIRTGIKDVSEMSSLLALHPELIRFILATQLQPNGWIDATFKITSTGEKLLDAAEDSRINLRVGYAFQDAISGNWLPRFLTELPEIAPVSYDHENRPQFILDKAKGRKESAFILPSRSGPKANLSLLNEAYRTYQKDLSFARRTDLTSEPGIHIQQVEAISDTPTKAYLWCELYKEQDDGQRWLVSDPFRLRRAASWLRKPLIEIAPTSPALLQRMQELVDLSPDQLSANEWLSNVEQSIDLELYAKYPYVEGHELIKEHLAGLLRQQSRLASRPRPNREEMGILVGEAHNLLEAVLKWLVLKWPVDTKNWSAKYRHRNDAIEDYRSVGRNGLDCVNEELIQQLASQSMGNIIAAIQTGDRPLKALLAAAVYCADEQADHPFRRVSAELLRLDILPTLADYRNKVSGHASGEKALLEEALMAANFAIQWMELFREWY